MQRRFVWFENFMIEINHRSEERDPATSIPHTTAAVRSILEMDEERDSLDNLIEDIDFDQLTPTKDQLHKDSPPRDLNQLLDDVSNVFFDNLEEEAATRGAAEEGKKGNSEEETLFDDINLSNYEKLSSKRELETAITGVPFHLRKKWMDVLMSEQLQPPNISRLGHSYAYSSWNHQSSSTSIPLSSSSTSAPAASAPTGSSLSLDKSLRDLIMKASSKSDLSAAEVQQLERFLIAGEENKLRYLRSVLLTNRERIAQDSDYKPAKYPELAAMLKNIASSS
jgi:hypothetical protein